MSENKFNVDDAIEHAYRQGYLSGRCAADSRIECIAVHYGYENQREQFVEECAEAILAVQKCKRYGTKENFKNLMNEVADVIIMAQQLRILMSTREIDEIINVKLERQMRRIKEENI